MSDVKSDTVDTILSHVFTGTTADPIIATLLLVILLMGVAAYFMWKRINDKEKQLSEASNELAELTDKYVKSIENMHQQQLELINAQHEAMSKTHLLLVEIKTLLGFLSSR